MAIYLRGTSYYYDFMHKGQRYVGCIGKVSRTVAKEELARKKTAVLEQRLNPTKSRKSPRFDVFAHEYLEWLKANRKPLTHVKFSSTVKRLTEFFGAKKLDEITAWQIEQYKKVRREANRLPSTINIELAILKAMLRKAQQWNKLGELPTKDVKPLKGVQGKMRFLSEAEEAQLLAASSPALRKVITTGLLTGFRRQELAYLRVEDIDFGRGTVTVAACYAKNGESRTVPMGEQLRLVLTEAVTGRDSASPVFTNRYGKPWSTNGLTEAVSYASQRAGLERLGPHVLRHTFASRLVMAGVDLRTVQELMGHKDIAMTVRYAHLSSDHKRAAITALETAFSAKSPTIFHNSTVPATLTSSTKLVAVR